MESFLSSPELVSFPFKFYVWKLPIWNPSSPVLNWSAFLSSSLCGSWSAFLSDSFCGSFQFGSFFVYMFSVWKVVSFPFRFLLWKLPIWKLFCVYVLSGCLKGPVHLFWCGTVLHFENRFHTRSELVSFPFKFPVWKLPIWNPSSPVLNWSAFLSSSLYGSFQFGILPLQS